MSACRHAELELECEDRMRAGQPGCGICRPCLRRQLDEARGDAARMRAALERIAKEECAFTGSYENCDEAKKCGELLEEQDWCSGCIARAALTGTPAEPAPNPPQPPLPQGVETGCSKCGAKPADYVCCGCWRPFCRPCARGKCEHCVPPSAPQAPATGLDPRDAEIARLKSLIDRDRTGLAAALVEVKKRANGGRWISEGRGSYRYDEDDYRKETGWLVADIAKLAEDALRASGNLANEAFHLPLTSSREGVK